MPRGIPGFGPNAKAAKTARQQTNGATVVIGTPGTLTGVAEQAGDGDAFIQTQQPFRVAITIEGTAPLLCHRYSVESVAEKATMKKGSEGKKMDDVESYIYRDHDGFICLPGKYLKGALVEAAKFKQDPRSPRKSAKDLVRASVIPLTNLAQLIPIGSKGKPTKAWDGLDTQRVRVQQSAVSRTRPIFHEGWKASFVLMVSLPEYVTPALLRQILNDAGRLVGVGDFRPDYGRFEVVSWEVLGDD